MTYFNLTCKSVCITHIWVPYYEIVPKSCRLILMRIFVVFLIEAENGKGLEDSSTIQIWPSSPQLCHIWYCRAGYLEQHREDNYVLWPYPTSVSQPELLKDWEVPWKTWIMAKSFWFMPHMINLLIQNCIWTVPHGSDLWQTRLVYEHVLCHHAPGTSMHFTMTQLETELRPLARKQLWKVEKTNK